MNEPNSRNVLTVFAKKICMNVPSSVSHVGQSALLSLEIVCIHMGVRKNIWINLKLMSLMLLHVNVKCFLSQMFNQVFSSKTIPRSFSQIFKKVGKDE